MLEKGACVWTPWLKLLLRTLQYIGHGHDWMVCGASRELHPNPNLYISWAKMLGKPVCICSPGLKLPLRTLQYVYRWGPVGRPIPTPIYLSAGENWLKEAPSTSLQDWLIYRAWSRKHFIKFFFKLVAEKGDWCGGQCSAVGRSWLTTGYYRVTS